tara:strand:- start:996 stop:1433 length:438 start_codon:yes stop_codon:yes gene_type:complete
MKVSYNKLPKSLKKELENYRKSEGISTKDMIKKVEKNDQVVIKINYNFPHNWVMYNNILNDEGVLISDEEWKDKLKNFFIEKNSEYYKFIEQVGTHLFGNNVDKFFNIRENDDGKGKWEIILENPKVEDWLTIDVYLIPIDFEID